MGRPLLGAACITVSIVRFDSIRFDSMRSSQSASTRRPARNGTTRRQVKEKKTKKAARPSFWGLPSADERTGARRIARSKGWHQGGAPFLWRFKVSRVDLVKGCALGLAAEGLWRAVATTPAEGLKADVADRNVQKCKILLPSSSSSCTTPPRRAIGPPPIFNLDRTIKPGGCRQAGRRGGQGYPARPIQS